MGAALHDKSPWLLTRLKIVTAIRTGFRGELIYNVRASFVVCLSFVDIALMLGFICLLWEG